MSSFPCLLRIPQRCPLAASGKRIRIRIWLATGSDVGMRPFGWIVNYHRIVLRWLAGSAPRIGSLGWPQIKQLLHDQEDPLQARQTCKARQPRNSRAPLSFVETCVGHLRLCNMFDWDMQGLLLRLAGFKLLEQHACWFRHSRGLIAVADCWRRWALLLICRLIDQWLTDQAQVYGFRRCSALVLSMWLIALSHWHFRPQSSQLRNCARA